MIYFDERVCHYDLIFILAQIWIIWIDQWTMRSE